MKNIGLQKCLAQLAGAAFLTLAAIGAQAQTSGLQYKIMGGQVYAYEPSNPDAVYLIPNMTPEQVGLGGQANAQAQAAAQAQMNAQNGMVGNPAGVFPYNTNQGAYGFPNMPPPLPAKPAASNSALPAVTFRDPVFSTQNLPRLANPIGGLPRYPGKNYAPGYLASPW